MKRVISVNDLNLYKEKFSELVMDKHEYFINCLYDRFGGAFSSTRCENCPFEITDSTGGTHCISPYEFPYANGTEADDNYNCDMFDYSTISDEIEAIKVKVDEYVANQKAQKLQEAQDTFDMMLIEYGEQNNPKIVIADESHSLIASESNVDLKSNVISLDDSLDEYVIEYNDNYEITNTENGKIILKRKIIYPKTIGECYEIMKMDYTDFNFSENPSYEEREVYGKLALLRNIIVATYAYWKRLNWKPDWDDASQVKYCVSVTQRQHVTDNQFKVVIDYFQTTLSKTLVCMPDPESRQDFCNKFGSIITELAEFI